MKKKLHVIPLNTAAAGQWLKIHSLPDGVVHAQFIRFGIHAGERVRCIERLPGGTIVLKKNRQEIAVGHQLAEKIFVVVINGKDSKQAAKSDTHGK